MFGYQQNRDAYVLKDKRKQLRTICPGADHKDAAPNQMKLNVKLSAVQSWRHGDYVQAQTTALCGSSCQPCCPQCSPPQEDCWLLFPRQLAESWLSPVQLLRLLAAAGRHMLPLQGSRSSTQRRDHTRLRDGRRLQPTPAAARWPHIRWGRCPRGYSCRPASWTAWRPGCTAPRRSRRPWCRPTPPA